MLLCELVEWCRVGEGAASVDIGLLRDGERRRITQEGREGVLYGVFFFQAEDGIRDLTVTGVQTCALPICWSNRPMLAPTSTRLGTHQHFGSKRSRETIRGSASRSATLLVGDGARVLSMS